MNIYQDPLSLKNLFIKNSDYYHDLLNKQGYMLVEKKTGTFFVRFINSTIYGTPITPTMFFTDEQVMYHHMKSKQEQNNTIDNDGDAVE
jgi:hypothetical protein